MDLSFQLNIACGKISGIASRTTSHEEALAKYSADVERENNLEEGALKHAILTAVPFKPCMPMIYRDRMSIFSHAVSDSNRVVS